MDGSVPLASVSFKFMCCFLLPPQFHCKFSLLARISNFDRIVFFTLFFCSGDNNDQC